jgi:hypothetical protein
MPAYKPYPTVADNPNRKARKSQRKNIFAYNQQLMNDIRRAKRKERQEARKAEAERLAKEAEEKAIMEQLEAEQAPQA